MSSHLLSDAAKEHTVQDDIESFFWVLIYVGLYYLHLNQKHYVGPVEDIVTSIFNQGEYFEGIGHVGGSRKKEFITGDYFRRTLTFTDNEALTTFYQDFRAILWNYHTWLNKVYNDEPKPEAVSEIIMYKMPDEIKCTHAQMWPIFDKALQDDNWVKERIAFKDVQKIPGPGTSKRKSTTEEELKFSRVTRSKTQKTDKCKMPIM